MGCMDGWLRRREKKFKHCFFPARREIAHEKKTKKKYLTPIQSNTNGSGEEKKSEKGRKKIARKKLHNFFSLLSAYVVECLSVICCCNCCCRMWQQQKKIYYATQYLPFIPLPIHLYGTFFFHLLYMCIYIELCGVLVVWMETLYIALKKNEAKDSMLLVWWTTHDCTEEKVWCHKMNLLSEVKSSSKIIIRIIRNLWSLSNFWGFMELRQNFSSNFFFFISFQISF